MKSGSRPSAVGRTYLLESVYGGVVPGGCPVLPGARPCPNFPVVGEPEGRKVGLSHEKALHKK